MPFFTVIIPLYNKENFIENTLKSVLNQSFTNFEVIIVNDGSTDKSEEKVYQFNDVRIKYFSQENQGVSVARNFGISMASSNYISFIDADDYWYPNFLQEMFKTIKQFPNEKVFSAAKEIETAHRTFQAKYSIVKTNDYELVNYFTASSKESVIWTSSAVFHKSVFEVTGGFDPEIKMAEDTDLWIRIGIHYPVLFSWKILARYVYDQKSVSRNLNYSMDDRTFLKYKVEEKRNMALKKFLDLNRFSAAIKCKITGNKIRFQKLYNEIAMENLSFKKKMLLQLPDFILSTLVKLKSLLTKIGLGNAVFK